VGPEPGRYIIKAHGFDEAGRESRTIIHFQSLLADKRPYAIPAPLDSEQAKFHLDHDNNRTYKPGDVADLVITTPIYPCEGELVVYTTSNLIHRHLFIKSKQTKIQIPIDEGFVPHADVEVVLHPTISQDHSFFPNEFSARQPFGDLRAS